MMVPFANFQNTRWPFGTGGDLVVNSGQTVLLTPGTIYDYRNITINAGGTLKVDDPSNINNRTPVIVGCRDKFTNEGTVIGQISDLAVQQTVSLAGTWSKTTAFPSNSLYPPNFTVSYSIAQPLGGAGGKGGTDNIAFVGTGGAGTNGFGGGGGGGEGSDTTTGGINGDGGFNNGNGYPTTSNTGGNISGGTGNFTKGAGANGTSVSFTTSGSIITGMIKGRGGDGGGSGGGAGPGNYENYFPTYRGLGMGGGGGGGMRGKHGLAMYLKSRVVFGNGIFNFSGQNGFNGGNGGNAGKFGNVGVGGGGGGGGGGSGGSGGKIEIKTRYQFISLSNILVNRGEGGIGGIKGANVNGGVAAFDGINGNPGVAGSKTITVATND
jgi:hypothetical protein